MNLGIPNDPEQAKKAFLVAGVVLIIAVTPPLLIGWYLFAVFVAISAWRVL